MTTKSSKEFVFTGWHMLGILVLFFGTIIAVNLWMAISAMSTWTGLVVPNSYVASQQFNTKLTIAREREALGWQGGLDYAGGQLKFSLTDADGQPVRLTSVTVEVSRPVGIVGDTILDLKPLIDGTHAAFIDLEPGVWNAKIVATMPDAPDYEHGARLVVE